MVTKAGLDTTITGDSSLPPQADAQLLRAPSYNGLEFDDETGTFIINTSQFEVLRLVALYNNYSVNYSSRLGRPIVRRVGPRLEPNNRLNRAPPLRAFFSPSARFAAANRDHRRGHHTFSPRSRNRSATLRTS